MNANIFVTASKLKFRYPYKGMISTEDLWDLNLDQLDMVYKTLNKEVKVTQEDSLLVTVKGRTEMDDILDMKINIVKYIFEEKVEAARKREAEVINAEKKRRILEVLAKKQNDSLNNMSEEELYKMLDEIG